MESYGVETENADHTKEPSHRFDSTDFAIIQHLTIAINDW